MANVLETTTWNDNECCLNINTGPKRADTTFNLNYEWKQSSWKCRTKTKLFSYSYEFLKKSYTIAYALGEIQKQNKHKKCTLGTSIKQLTQKRVRNGKTKHLHKLLYLTPVH